MCDSIFHQSYLDIDIGAKASLFFDSALTRYKRYPGLPVGSALT